MFWYSDNVVSEKKDINFELFSTEKQILGSNINFFNRNSLIYSGFINKYNTRITLPPIYSEIEEYKIEVITKNKRKLVLPYTVLNLNKEEPYIVCDIDFTLSATNVFLYMTRNIVHIKTIINSVEVLNDLSKKFKIIYLTGRLEKYTKLSKIWIEKNNYPKGPLLARPKTYSLNLEIFKTNVLKQITIISKNSVGIGDLESDIMAYKNNGIIPIKIKHPLLFYSKKESYKYLDSYYLVNSWYGIEKIFKEKNLLKI